MIVYKNLLMENCNLHLVLSKKNKPQEIQELSEYENAFNLYKLLFVSQQSGLVLNTIKGTLKEIIKKVFSNVKDTLKINGFEFNLKGNKNDLYETLLALVEPLSEKENFATFVKFECINTLEYTAIYSQLEIKGVN